MNRNYHILIVEDEGIQAMALEETLERNGFAVAAVTDHGAEALEIVQTSAVDLVILDVNIKGEWDGIETARRIQQVKSIPLIFLTAYMDTRTQERAETTHPAAFLNKPYNEKRLILAVNDALNAAAPITPGSN